MPAIAPFRLSPPTLAAPFAVAGMLAGAHPTAAADYARLERFEHLFPQRFEARDLDGRPIVVEADGERVTLVHFFASWCEPCEAELPSLAAFLAAEPGAVRLVGVAVGEPTSRARKFVARFALPGAVAHDEDKAMTRAFGIKGLPATVAVAPKGRAALAATGEIDWRSPAVGAALADLSRQEH